MSAQWPASTGGLLWRADLIFCGEAEGSSSVSDPEGCSLSPSWDPVSPTSSRRNLNLDKNRCHTKYQPHTISNRTISSVATNTSRVSPTLCHILRAGGWARAQRRAAERRGGMDRGCPRAAPPGGGTWRCGGGPRRDRPSDLPPAGATESLVERALGRHYRLLIAPGSRSHGERRGRRRTDALPWRTSRRGKSDLEVARRTPGPGCSSLEVPLLPRRRQMSTTPRGRCRDRKSVV